MSFQNLHPSTKHEPVDEKTAITDLTHFFIKLNFWKQLEIIKHENPDIANAISSSYADPVLLRLNILWRWLEGFIYLIGQAIALACGI